MGSGQRDDGAAALVVTPSATLEALIAASPIAILALDLDMRVTLWNPAAERMFGWPAAEVLQRPYPLVPVEELERFRVLFDRVVSGEGFSGVEARRLRRDGTYIDVSISTAPMRAEAGQVVATMALLEDITARKRTERALVDELERRAVLAADNERLFQEARDAVRLREEFLAVASHELRTPCTSLNLAVQGLARLVDTRPLVEVPEPFLRSALETAERQGRHLARLIDQLLDVSRIRAGHLVLRPEEVDLTRLVEGLLDDFKEQIAHAGSSATLAHDGPVRGQWDPTRLAQVVTNLVSNAVRYGGGAPIEIAVHGDDESATLVVRDHGIGIAPERLESIFRPFERAASAEHFGGLGLGLYIVRYLVEAMGGTVRVRSAPGAGATFTVVLPR